MSMADLPECIHQFTTQFESGVPLTADATLAPVRSVRRGTATFTPARVSACLASVNQLICAGRSIKGTLAGCFDVTTRGGNSCHSSFDCLPGTTCNGPACTSTCTAGGNLGEGCIFGPPGQPGTCNSGLSCVGGLCLQPVPVGAACYGSTGCGPSGRCRQGRCEALPVAGAPCPDFECAPGAFCTTATVCQALGGVGSTCGGSDECLPTLFCGTNGQCTPRIAAGNPCVGQSCVATAHCSPRNNLCQTNRSVGQSCQQTVECAPGLVCDDVVRTCQSPTFAASGQPCSSARTCSVGSERCRGRVVNADGGVGASGTCGVTSAADACRSIADCSPAQFCSSTTNTCQPASLGTPCDEPVHCRPSDYCLGTGVCAGRAASGQLCDAQEFDSCAAPLEYCQLGAGAQHRCQRNPTVNESCMTRPCQFPWICDTGVCAGAGRRGQPCLEGTFGACLDGECTLGDGGVAPLFVFDGVTNHRCTAPRAAGQTCWSDRGCQSGWCDHRGSEVPGVCIAACR
jgi:hypothetical protein